MGVYTTGYGCRSTSQSDLLTSRCGCSVAKSCPTLCDPVDRSTPGSPVHHQLPDLAQTHVHWVGDAIQPSHPLSSFCSCTPSFPASGSFPMSWHCASGGQSIGASASASVLPMNLQGCFPLGLTGLIYLQFKGLSRVFTRRASKCFLGLIVTIGFFTLKYNLNVSAVWFLTVFFCLFVFSQRNEFHFHGLFVHIFCLLVDTYFQRYVIICFGMYPSPLCS